MPNPDTKVPPHGFGVIGNAEEASAKLFGLAVEGDAAAIRAMVELAALLASQVSDLACLHQEKINAVARTKVSWPINCDVHPEFRKRNLRWLRVLPLGKDTMWKPIGRKRYGVGDGANGVVVRAIQTINLFRSFAPISSTSIPPWRQAMLALPNLDGSKETADAWFEAIWSYLLECHGGRPETDAALRAIGYSHAESHKLDAPRAKPSYQQNICQGIRIALRLAFSRVSKAPKPTNSMK